MCVVSYLAKITETIVCNVLWRAGVSPMLMKGKLESKKR